MGFYDVAKQQRGQKMYGFRIQLVASGSYPAQTLHLTTHDAIVGTTEWEGVVASHSNITRQIAFSQPIEKRSKVKLHVIDRAVSANQDYGFKFSYLCEVYDFAGATMDVFLLAEDSDGTFENCCIWTGEIVSAPKRLDNGLVEIEGENLRDLDQPLPDEIKLDNYPDAPAEHVGLTRPIVYGDCRCKRENTSITNTTTQQYCEDIGLRDYAPCVPAVCVENDKSAAQFLYFMGCQHAAKSYNETWSHDVFYYARSQRELCPEAFQNDSNTNAAGLVQKLAHWASYWLPVHPSWIDTVNTNCLNPEYAMDSTTLYPAQLSRDNGPDLYLTPTRPPDLGYVGSVRVIAILDYDLTTDNTTVQVGLKDMTGGGAGVWIGTPVSVTNVAATWTHLVDVPWAILSKIDAMPSDIALVVHHAWSGGNDWVKVWELGMSVQYWPRFDLYSRAGDSPGLKWDEHKYGHRIPWKYIRDPLEEEFYSLDSQDLTIFMSIQGRPDHLDLWTGTPNGLIKRPAHIVCDLLNYFGGVASGYILFNDATMHADAKDAGTDQTTDTVQMAFSLLEGRTLKQIIERVNKQSLQTLVEAYKPTWARTKYGIVYWGSPAAVNYFGEIHYDFVSTISIGETNSRNVRNAISCPYDYSYHERKCRKVCYLDRNGSDDGKGGTLDEPIDLSPLTESYNRFGTRKHSQRLDLIHTQWGACNVRNLYALYLRLPRPELKIRFNNWEYIELQVGHTTRLNHDSFYNAGYRYPGVTGVFDDPGYWEAGSAYHYFWVEKVTIGPGWQEVTLVEGDWSW